MEETQFWIAVATAVGGLAAAGTAVAAGLQLRRERRERRAAALWALARELSRAYVTMAWSDELAEAWRAVREVGLRPPPVVEVVAALGNRFQKPIANLDASVQLKQLAEPALRWVAEQLDVDVRLLFARDELFVEAVNFAMWHHVGAARTVPSYAITIGTGIFTVFAADERQARRQLMTWMGATPSAYPDDGELLDALRARLEVTCDRVPPISGENDDKPEWVLTIRYPTRGSGCWKPVCHQEITLQEPPGDPAVRDRQALERWQPEVRFIGPVHPSPPKNSVT